MRLVELDPTSPQYAPAVWNSVDAPGPREGTLSPLDDWTADRLRAAGFKLADTVIVLERKQLNGRSPDPDPIDDVLIVILGTTVLLVSGLMFFVLRRRWRNGL